MFNPNTCDGHTYVLGSKIILRTSDIGFFFFLFRQEKFVVYKWPSFFFFFHYFFITRKLPYIECLVKSNVVFLIVSNAWSKVPYYVVFLIVYSFTTRLYAQSLNFDITVFMLILLFWFLDKLISLSHLFLF